MKVCLLTEKDVNGNIFSVSYSRYDYALYLMCLLTEDDIEYKMRDPFMKESVIRYLSDHQSLIKAKLLNLGVNDIEEKPLNELCRIYSNLCFEDFITLDEFCKKYKEEIDAVLDDEKNDTLLESAIEATEQSTTIGNIITQKETIIQEQTKKLNKSKQDGIEPQQ